jgi:hypothetical protein
MSISNDEWKAGRTSATIEERILAFLKQNDKPFSFLGIMKGIGFNTNVRDVETLFHGVIDGFTVLNSLDKLIVDGKVISRVIQQPEGQETYYKAF